jgi:hypothetical protein
MRKEMYNEVVNKVIYIINDGVVLMTEKEEFAYKKAVIKDLQVWLKAFPFLHILPEKRK